MDNKEISRNTLKRYAILDAAAELLVVKPTATMQEIADYAKIGIATLHRHFESREKLTLEIALRAIEMVTQALGSIQVETSNPQNTLTVIMEVLIPLGNKIYFLMVDDSLCGDANLMAAQAKIEEPLLQLIKQWQSAGYLRKDMPADWMLSVMNNLLFATWQNIHDGRLARKSAADLLVQTLLFGFSSPSDNQPAN